MLDRAKRWRGHFTAEQVRIAKVLASGKKKPFSVIVGMDVSEPVWDSFVEAGLKARKLSNKDKRKLERSQRKRKQKGKKAPKESFKGFYMSKEWRALRIRVMERYGCKCMMCGRSPKDHGIVIHVDHIKPKSKYPHLALDFNNLQLLCEDCNIGKSNLYDTDWRPDCEQEELLDDEQHAHMMAIAREIQ